jgi:hypothetical protein
MILAKMIHSYAELHQRIGLICHNCVKYNGRSSDYGAVAREFEAHADDCIVQAVTAAAAAAEATAAQEKGATTKAEVEANDTPGKQQQA